MQSYIANIITDLKELESLLIELIDNSRILKFQNDPDSSLVFIVPDYYWDVSSEIELKIQRILKQKFSLWLQGFRILLSSSPISLQRKINDNLTNISNWIERSSDDWTVPSTIELAKSNLNDQISIIEQYLVSLMKSTSPEIFIIPDTNSLISFPNPLDYTRLGIGDFYSLIILPTVLSELDNLKTRKQNTELVSKVNSVIKRFKGYRTQGNILEGVIIHSSITIKMIPTEPDMAYSLSWLDKDNNDDKIIASTLEIQRDHPTSTIFLVTQDLNMQNKAAMARLPFLSFS